MKTQLVCSLFVLLSTAASSTPLTIATYPIVEDFFSDYQARVVQALESAGIDFTLVPLPAERGSRSLATSVIDAEIMRLDGYSEALPDAIKIDFPLTSVTFVAVVREHSSFESLSELQGKLMGVSLGIKIHSTIAEQFEAEVFTIDNYPNTIKMIESGRLDFTVASEEIVAHFQEQGFKVRSLSEPIAEQSFYFWLSPANADKAGLIREALEQYYEAPSGSDAP